MRILPNWIRDFVDTKANDHDLAESLTHAGIAVESIVEEHGHTIYEMDLTTNRVDAMNHYGVAREASAIFDIELKPVTPKLPKAEGTAKFAIELEDAQGCPRYTARIVRGVKVASSPKNIAQRLELLGSRAINNIADASNYALFEIGHPTHAFDLDTLEGGKIVVRRAREGETLKTLDGETRKLTSQDLVIADAVKAVALAGVMGGFDTMITEKTTNVLIESAWFDPASIRHTAKRLGMHTDASHRYERGADIAITALACDRVAELILETAGGKLEGEKIDAIARKIEPRTVQLRRSEVKRHLGLDLPEQEIERILRRLGFGVDGETVTIPSWRLDVEREIDVIEELARIHGYNNFPNTLPSFAGGVIELPDEQKRARVREILLALGYNEAISLTFASKEDAAQFGGGEPLAIANPLNEEQGYLRTSLLPGMLGMIAYNLNRGNTDVRLFESGDVFEKTGERFEERRRLCFAATGNSIEASVHTKAKATDFFDLKGDVEDLLAAFTKRTVYFDTLVPEYYHPGRAARIVLDGATVGYVGQLHPSVADVRKLKQDVYLAEILQERLFQHDLKAPRFTAISRYPAVERDFSFVFDDAVTFDRVREAVEALGITEMTSFQAVEIFRGGSVPAGKYSFLVRAAFQSAERTLRDEEVANWSGQIIKALEILGGALRG
ncbi:phenylalanyl-tRNA synthetase beta subunit [Candidatus Koribacter versatilis Ellin345]|uniref:Phenylalanine--tRNA ligase beta subunit n=1 Tax=Koribacter versatilis (strain Ellin345) TaxID=204669 RepID=Q1ITS7_KORVE|nr:phenylalanine--tRNA ligase subunit beta [Candidatus Koribacter versatilis]ABF39723.1 phenylalanyl-tRNA synthetase beta subunit [Candidatus Koribacter versatilis Ellin345]